MRFDFPPSHSWYSNSSVIGIPRSSCYRMVCSRAQGGIWAKFPPPKRSWPWQSKEALERVVRPVTCRTEMLLFLANCPCVAHDTCITRYQFHAMIRLIYVTGTFTSQLEPWTQLDCYNFTGLLKLGLFDRATTLIMWSDWLKYRPTIHY